MTCYRQKHFLITLSLSLLAAVGEKLGIAGFCLLLVALIILFLILFRLVRQRANETAALQALSTANTLAKGKEHKSHFPFVIRWVFVKDTLCAGNGFWCAITLCVLIQRFCWTWKGAKVSFWGKKPIDRDSHQCFVYCIFILVFAFYVLFMFCFCSYYYSYTSGNQTTSDCEGEMYMNYQPTDQAYTDLAPAYMTGDDVYSSLSWTAWQGGDMQKTNK